MMTSRHFTGDIFLLLFLAVLALFVDETQTAADRPSTTVAEEREKKRESVTAISNYSTMLSDRSFNNESFFSQPRFALGSVGISALADAGHESSPVVVPLFFCCGVQCSLQYLQISIVSLVSAIKEERNDDDAGAAASAATAVAMCTKSQRRRRSNMISLFSLSLIGLVRKVFLLQCGENSRHLSRMCCRMDQRWTGTDRQTGGREEFHIFLGVGRSVILRR